MHEQQVAVISREVPVLDKLKRLLRATTLLMIISFVFLSCPLGIWTAVYAEQSTGWTVFDVLASLFVPLYGSIIWVIHVFV